MLSWRSGLVAAAILALASTSCGMRGGSQATIIDGFQGRAGSGGTGQTGSALPSGVHLRASATGISSTTIHLGTIDDIGGPVPGLFQTALDGVKAWVAYQNAHGGIDGRKIVLDTYDSGLSPTKFNQAMTQACSQDFAVVAAMSAADEAGAATGAQCGIPDVADNPTTPQAAGSPNEFAADPSMPNEYPDGWWIWLKKNFPAAAKSAAIMWPNDSTTEITGKRLEDTAKSVGFHFTYATSVPLLEADFLPYVEAMKAHHVQYFAWQADNQSMARILQAMQQLNWHPEIVDTTATAYSQSFLDEAGAAANGIYFSLNVGLYSEAKQNPAIATLLSWLSKTVPNHQPPDIFDIYSWTAGELLTQAMQTAGYNPTRAQVISALKAIHHFPTNGLMAPMDPGGHKASACFEVVKVEKGKFVRVHPSKPDSFDCSTGSLYVDPNIPPA